MSYKVTGKNFAINRLMPRGTGAEPRLRYMHCGPEGTTVVGPAYVARVSLPDKENCVPLGNLVWPQDAVDGIKRPPPESLEVVNLPPGEPAVDGPRFMIPAMTEQFFDPTEDMPSFVVNADMLRKMLTVASEVCEDSDKACRLRYDPKTNRLRIDSYAQPGDQTFVGVMKCMKYSGGYIAGDIVTDASKVEQKPMQGNLVLKMSAGRKFRGEGE
jgi:hypothetical protein